MSTSMWVGTVNKKGELTAAVAAPGGGFFTFSSRIGDYSTTVLDDDGMTFWSANEYIGNNGTTDIWLTHIASFAVPGVCAIPPGFPTGTFSAGVISITSGCGIQSITP